MDGADREFVVVDNPLHVHQARRVGARNVFGTRSHVVAHLVAPHADRHGVLLDGEHAAETTAFVAARRLGDVDVPDQREQVAQLRHIGHVQLAGR